MISVAVIGCGYWGKNLVRNFGEIGALAAISDADPQAREQAMEANGVPHREVDDIMGDKAIDAVVIATPADTHHALALQALEAGKHVFIEKPIALTLEDAREIVDLACDRKRTLMVGHLLQYHPAFIKLKQMVKDDAIGELRYIYSRRLNIGKLRVHENVLWSFAPHDISMILSLVGHEPDHVVGFAGNFLTETVSDFATVQMEFPSRIKAHVEVSWLNPTKEQRLTVIGDKGMIVFDDRASWDEKLTIYRHRAEIVKGFPVLEPAAGEHVAVPEGEPLRSECEHFLRFIETGETPFTVGAEAIAVLRVLRAGDASREGWTGNPVKS